MTAHLEYERTGIMADHDRPKDGEASRFDQIFGFIGAVGFLALLAAIQH
jgi:hypothetical protein